ncbi:MAG: hypothetical protein Kow0049_32850 [Stanieria sp.]
MLGGLEEDSIGTFFSQSVSAAEKGINFFGSLSTRNDGIYYDATGDRIPFQDSGTAEADVLQLAGTLGFDLSENQNLQFSVTHNRDEYDYSIISDPSVNDLPSGATSARALDIEQDYGEILNTRVWNTSFFGRVFDLHYALLAGQTGIVIAGIAALLMFILGITGLVLWPGWHNLISGFKIKWNARTKRLNFDLHKVVGIISAFFLTAIAFTGFCCNFYAQTEPLIYAATFSPKPVEPVSQVIPGKASIGLNEILQRAETALPGGKVTYIGLPTEPEGVFRIYKQLPGQKDKWSSEVALDRYTGKVLKVTDATKSLSLGTTVLNSFFSGNGILAHHQPTRWLRIGLG